MNKLIAPAALALMLGTGLGAGAALAQAMPPLADLDADANGTISLTELQAAVPAATEDDFAVFDTDGDGELNADEFQGLSDAMMQAEPAPAEPAPAEPMDAPAM